MVVESDGRRRGIDIFARKGARAIAVNDGKVVGIGRSKRLGRFVKLLDVYGNTYTYAHLGKVAKTYPAPKKRTAKRSEIRRELKLDDRRRRRAASATKAPAGKRAGRRQAAKKRARQAAPGGRGARRPRHRRPRSACSPTRRARTPASPAAPSSSASRPR